MHGGLLQDKQFVQGFIADSYIDIQAARLMTIHAAEKIDQGLEGARTDISAIKVFVPAAYDAGRRPGHPGLGRGRRLQRPARWPAMYQGARTLRIADGPDEVHKILIAKNVLGHYATGAAGTSGTEVHPRPLGRGYGDGTAGSCGPAAAGEPSSAVEMTHR